MDENKKNANEIDDVLKKLRESVGNSGRGTGSGKKKTDASGGYDRELAELLRRHLGDEAKEAGGKETGGGEVRERGEEYSVEDLSIVKDGSVDPKRFGDEIRSEDIIPGRAVEVGGGSPSDDGVPSGGANADEAPMPLAVLEALEDAFRVDMSDPSRVPEETETFDEYGFDFAAEPEPDEDADSVGELAALDGCASFDVADSADCDDINVIADADSDEACESELCAGEYEPYVALSDEAGGEDAPYAFAEVDETEAAEPAASVSDAAESPAASFEKEVDERPGNSDRSSSIASQNNKSQPQYSENDIKMMLMLGYETELGEQIGQEKLRDIKDGREPSGRVGSNSEPGIPPDALSYRGGEYVSHSQDGEIKNDCRRAALVASGRLAGAVSFALILGVLENIGYFGVVLPKALNPSGSPLTFTLITLALFLASAAIFRRQIVGGLVRIVRFDPDPHSLTAAAAALNIIYDLAVVIIRPEAAQLYNFPAALCLVLTALSELFDAARERDTFAIISAEGERYTLAHTGSATDHIASSGGASSGGSKRRIPVYSVICADFTGGYFRRTNEKKKGIYLLNYILIPTVAVGAVMAIITAGVTSDAAGSLAAALASVFICLPASLLLLISMPHSLASRRLRRQGCALVGPSGVDEYSRRKQIVFEDRTMFPSHGIRTKGLKLFDGFEIYDVLVKTGSLFSVIGGPLGEIFEVSDEKYHPSKDVKLIRAERGGVEALLDGATHLLAGSFEFLEKYGISPRRNPRDEQIAAAGEVTIIYIAVDRRAAARLYVDYRPDAEFERVAQILSERGVKVAIRTSDPGIDEVMLERKRGPGVSEVSVLRPNTPAPDGSADSVGAGGAVDRVDTVDSGIVSLGSPCGIAEPVIVASELKKVRRRGLATMFGVFIINIIFSAVLAVTGAIGFITSGVAAAYLLLWLLPVFFITFSALRGE